MEHGDIIVVTEGNNQFINIHCLKFSDKENISLVFDALRSVLNRGSVIYFDGTIRFNESSVIIEGSRHSWRSYSGEYTDNQFLEDHYIETVRKEKLPILDQFFNWICRGKDHLNSNQIFGIVIKKKSFRKQEIIYPVNKASVCKHFL